MVFYVVSKVPPPQPRTDRYGPFESEQKARDEANRLAVLAKGKRIEVQVVCDFG